ncbi:MAG: outer membrane protein assembly factor BamA [Gammaproteobacteria bacterium]|nr:outer membrane protein assembly factor BamA [Gammaproteobacteria bacterium]
MARSLKQIALVAILIFALASSAFADTFIVKKIQINGLQRVSQGTVLNYLPIQVGDSFDTADTGNVISALYQTGFFSTISLARDGDTLVINVQERPTIGTVKITGNKLIATKDLTKALSGFGIGSGQVYDQAVVDNVRLSLERQYYQQGNYNAKVAIVATPTTSNRIDLQITIDEGSAAAIKEIDIIGNKAFSKKVLLKQFKLKTNGWIARFMKSDQYSKEKLDGDLESLKSFYMNKGYIEFKVNSTEVTMTPDKKYVYIVVNITEGPKYTISGFKLQGNLLYPEADLNKLVTLKPGQTFSRAVVTQNAQALITYYGNYGYAFAKVQPVPQIDSVNHQVMMNFMIDPGKKVYVRQINFVGNTKTEDQVLRREMRQQEGALVSSSNIQESERRLNMLGYFKNVKVDTVPVEGSDDQVDLNVNVTEAPSATLTAGIGYSDTDGLLLNAGYNQPNFFGTGKNLGVNFNTSDYQRYYSVSYFNPYYTDSGIGRGFNLYASTTNTDDSNVDISTYAMDQYGLSMNFSVPLSETNSLSYGIGYQISRIELGDDPSEELVNFFNGTNTLPPPDPVAETDAETFNNVLLTGGWTHVNFDRGIFPTRGFGQTVNLTLGLPGGGQEQNYYKANYLAHLYIPVTHGFILSIRGELGYGGGLFGTDALPFYNNYYAGGIGVTGAVRGYEGYSIGPQDSNGDTYGGNALADGTFGLVIPTGISPDTFRLTTFIDMGNVYNTSGVETTTGSGPMRFSAGVQGEWRSPIGPLVLSLAYPLNAQPQDSREPLQFTIGTSF